MDKPADKKRRSARPQSLTRREALRRIATLGAISVPLALAGCRDTNPPAAAPAGETYTSGGYSSSYKSAYSSGRAYSSTYGSGYSSQYCSGNGSLYYYSYRCSTRYRSYGSTYTSGG